MKAQIIIAACLIAVSALSQTNTDAKERARIAQVEATSNAILDGWAHPRSGSPGQMIESLRITAQDLKDYILLQGYRIKDVTADGIRVSKAESERDFFVRGGSGFSDAPYSALLVFDGTYTYSTVAGSTRKVPALRKPTPAEVIIFENRRNQIAAQLAREADRISKLTPLQRARERNDELSRRAFGP